jgi:purine-nucleoside phosphorylase
MSEMLSKIYQARDYIKSKTTIKPELAIILGSGLGKLADEVKVDVSISYEDIPGFPVSTVQGHSGKLILGVLGGKKVVIMKGRVHYYEGHPMSDVIFPMRVLHTLGPKTLIVTNAAGGLNSKFSPGEVMLINDHLNMMGANALIGENIDEFGPRFPDMTFTYTPELLQLARDVAKEANIPLQEGVYAAWSGPTYETRAERRYLRIIGGDAVGMSTVPEATVANHAGMDILGFSAITNVATGEIDQPADSHEHVLKMADVAGTHLVKLVGLIIEKM